MALIRTVELGSPATGTVSKATFTDLAELDWHEPEVAEDQVAVDGVVLDKTLLDEKPDSNAEIFNKLFHDYEDLAAAGTAHEVFDTTDVDIKSLANYIKWLRKKPKHLKPNQVGSQLLQARLILAVAQHTGGKYHQRKNPAILAACTTTAPAYKTSVRNCEEQCWATAGNTTFAPVLLLGKWGLRTNG